MRIQQIATLTGASQKAIRLYEALGLLGPVPRRGAYRAYSADHVALVSMVRRAQAFGFTLAQLRTAQRGGQVDWAAVLDLVQDRRRALAAERARLARLDRELRAIEDELLHRVGPGDVAPLLQRLLGGLQVGLQRLVAGASGAPCRRC